MYPQQDQSNNAAFNCADVLVHDDDWQLCVNQVKWAYVHTLLLIVEVYEWTAHMPTFAQ